MLLLASGVFAAVARMCLQLVQGRARSEGLDCSDAENAAGSDAAVLRGAARGARLAVRLAFGMDPHLIEEWTRNQCEDREGDPSGARVRRGARAESLSRQWRFDGAQDKECV